MSSGEAVGLSVGSQWRRWDPHVHFPGTLLNDQFGSTTIEDSLEVIAEREPLIEAVGVTDYFSTRSFKAVEAAWKSGCGASIKYVFPNVELRLSDATAAGRGINLHVLAAPEDVEVLDEMLARLHFSFQDEEYPADDAGLVRLGRAFKGNTALDEGIARKEGANQFKVNITDLKKLFQGDAKYARKCLVGVAAGKDGSSGMRAPDGGFDAYRQGLERFANFIFSGNPKDREFWLGQGGKLDEAQIEQAYGGLKLCLHGSDAHEVSKLGAPDLDRFCWLKGDATFDTLWQACLAPERRASIGSSSPDDGQYGRIDSVTIADKSWFTPGTVPLNTGLVAIIGARGSGKTALADLVAVGTGSLEPFANTASFVHRAGSLLDGQTATVTWRGDDSTSYALDRPYGSDASEPRRVRYLSQQFVEELCSSDGVTNELLTEIERVIFEAWPVEARQGATSFQELLAIRLADARARQAEELQSIQDISKEATRQRVLQRGGKQKADDQKSAATGIATLVAQIKELTGKVDQKSGERHGEISRVLAKRQEEAQRLDRQVTDLRNLRSAVATTRDSQFPSIRQRFQQQHPRSGLSEDAWQAFLPQFSGDVNGILAEAEAAAAAGHQSIVGKSVPADSTLTLDGVDVNDLASRTVAELVFEQARLQRLVGLDTRRAQNLTQLQNQLNKARSAKAKLDQEVADSQAAASRIAELSNARTERYQAYFNALLTEEAELRLLYAPLEQMLKNFGSSVSRLKLSVRRRVNLDAWVSYAERSLIDLRTAGPFRGTGGLFPIARDLLLGAWESGDGEAAAAAIQNFSAEYSNDLRAHARVNTKDDDAYREWEREVAGWLYGVGHIRVVYSLEYDGLNVERLSPGSRGIVLLLLYLAVDQTETDPLIIDQPEENLDPKSIYTELVKLFKTASERRQIIMVTHNANLVVNTDVDQVIVATCEQLEEGKLPKLSYRAGGLESLEIRRAVCEVLEGGADAFKLRARRLHIDAPAVLGTE